MAGVWHVMNKLHWRWLVLTFKVIPTASKLSVREVHYPGWRWLAFRILDVQRDSSMNTRQVQAVDTY